MDYGTDLYIIQMQKTGDIKVGRTSCLRQRLVTLQTGSPYMLKVLVHLPGCGHMEKDLHAILDCRGLRKKGEWFAEEALDELPPELYELLVLDERDWWKNST